MATVTIEAQKARLRQEASARREALPHEARLERSEAIRRRLCALPEFQTAQCLHSYLATPSEVHTDGVIREALARGMRVVVPYAAPDGHQLRLSALLDVDHGLAPGRWGILEPTEAMRRPVPLSDVDLMVLPGVAFDHEGHRLGRGTGHFDRLLAERSPSSSASSASGGGSGGGFLLVGLCFACQLVEHVPTGQTDVPMDVVITEAQLLRIRRPG